ncbi:MAG: polyprenyl synthetase family protein [Candidatus Cloacimonetes bacterium]|nr:polyprenyl synthetase family protein [Candidatus Cloacimonadota bacterium]
MLIQRYFETRLELIENALKSYLSFDNIYSKNLIEAMRYTVFSGGKRWRPLLTIAVYEMLTNPRKNSDLSDIIKAACALELIHNASLIHDDLPQVNDRKDRRGNQSCHRKFGHATAIMAADALYTIAFEVIAGLSDPKKALTGVRMLSDYCKTYGMIGGQAVDLLNKRKVMKLNTLRFIDLKKTGSLLEAAADLACLIAETDAETRQLMINYTQNLGYAYQIIEDIIEDYNRSGDDLDFSQDFIPTSKSSYTGLMGFDKARHAGEKLLLECTKIIRPYPNNDILNEFIQMIQERLP